MIRYNFKKGLTNNKQNVDFYFKEKACEIINYIAYSVNRFYVQRKIEKLINNGIEPTLEEILKK